MTLVLYRRRNDARLLRRLMLENNFPQIWVPSPENRDLRQLLWHRHRLVQMRTRIMNQLQALAMNEGYRWKKKLFSEQGRAQLEKLALAPWASRRRQELLELLDRIHPTIEELTAAVEQEAKKRPEVLRLMTHPGVGPLTALAYGLIIGTPERFHCRKQIAFLYQPERNHSVCPEGKVLHPQGRRERGPGMIYHLYEARATDCQACARKPECCPDNEKHGRSVARLEESPVVIAFRTKMASEEARKQYRRRGRIVEFCHAWIKSKLGLRQFHVRGLKKVQMEMLRVCLTYNLQHWIRLSKLRATPAVT